VSAVHIPFDYGAKGGTLLNLTVPGMALGNRTAYACRFEPPLAYALAAARYSAAWWGGARGDALGGALLRAASGSGDDDEARSAALAAVEVDASALDVSTLHCVTPAWGAWRCATLTTLVVTQNGSEVAVALDLGNFTYSNNLSYHFFEVRRVMPRKHAFCAHFMSCSWNMWQL
jgi:hypothetical protein